MTIDYRVLTFRNRDVAIRSPDKLDTVTTHNNTPIEINPLMNNLNEL